MCYRRARRRGHGGAARGHARGSRPAPYYTKSRPATAKTFRDSVSFERRITLSSLDLLEQFGKDRLDGNWFYNRSVHVLYNRADTFWARRGKRLRPLFFKWWRSIAFAARRETRIVSAAFLGWAWRPDGALVGGLAAKHAGAFLREAGETKKCRVGEMATKGSNSQTAYKGSFQVVDIGEFIRFSDGSKLKAAQTENQASQYGTNPLDIGKMRLYELNGVLYVLLKDLTAPNPLADQNMAGYRIMEILGAQ